jgi:hypothetical protein
MTPEGDESRLLGLGTWGGCRARRASGFSGDAALTDGLSWFDGTENYAETPSGTSPM